MHEREKVDFHCHTTASDGKLSPIQLLDKAKALGISTMAITDHDTIEGFRLASAHAQQIGVRLISGIELSCVWSGINLHVVGLNFDPQCESMLAAERSQIAVRQERAEMIAQRLSKRLKYEICLADVAAYAGGEQIGRPHFAQYLLDRGLVSSFATAFNKYLGAGKVGDVKSYWPEMSQAVRWIVEAGGVAVLAHAHRYKMTRTKLHACLVDFTVAGGRGIEVAYHGMDPGQQQQMVQFAKEFKLKGSCGSDFHGPNRFGLELGQMPAFPAGVEPVWAGF